MYFYQPYMYGPVATGRYATGKLHSSRAVDASGCCRSQYDMDCFVYHLKAALCVARCKEGAVQAVVFTCHFLRLHLFPY